MSTHFNAFFDVGVVRLLDEWVRSLATAGPHVDALVAKWRPRWRAADWSLEDAVSPTNESSVARILGPGGFGIRIHEKAAELYHCSPWKLFLYDSEHQHAARAACFEIARLLKSKVAIYAPELTGARVRNSDDLESVRRQLEAHWGAPAASLAELATNSESAPGWQYPGCYYVDHFVDIRAKQE